MKNEAKPILKRMSFYYLLAVLCTLLYAFIPDRFPARNISTPYLLLLCVGLVLYYGHRVSHAGRLSAMMKALSWMALLLILLRAVKYSVVAEVGVLARHTWYLYYVPMLLIPLLLFDIALLIAPKKPGRSAIARYSALGMTMAFLLLILTNDLHQLVFRFRPAFADWDADYSHGLLFYAVTVWEYALYAAAIVILFRKCRIVSAKKNAWFLLIPFVIGIAMSVLLITDTMPKINGTNWIEFPESLILMAVVVLECCMQLGLIPTNTKYGKLFRQFSIAAQITDPHGSAVYTSRSAIPLTTERFALPSGSRIGAHTVLHKLELPGGFGFWQDDLTELDRLNAELEESKEALAQEAELTHLRNELKERQARIDQRTLVYDTIAKRTQRQSQIISHLAETGCRTQDPAQKQACRRRITLLGAYIKRYANLTLLSQEHSEIEVGELGLSVSEVLHYLNFCGTPGEFLQNGDGTVSAAAALAAFEAFETLLEENHACLYGVFANLTVQQTVTFKLTFENLQVPLPDRMAQVLRDAGVVVDAQREDDVTYLCLTLPRGGVDG